VTAVLVIAFNVGVMIAALVIGALHSRAAERRLKQRTGERHRQEIAPLRQAIIDINVAPPVSACPFCGAGIGQPCDEAWVRP
jgi:hypothetical protein